jgi:hypothetical protein
MSDTYIRVSLENTTDFCKTERKYGYWHEIGNHQRVSEVNDAEMKNCKANHIRSPRRASSIN